MSEPLKQDYLSRLVVDSKQMKREAVKRRKQFDEKSVPHEEVEESKLQGWVVDRSGVKSVRLRKPCPVSERLENRFWMLLFKLGYPELCSGQAFTILVNKKGQPQFQEPISVFAKDDETVVVAICHSSEKIIKGKLHRELKHLSEIKGDLAQSIRRHYGDGFKPKIIWLFVTENIIWSTQDKESAAAETIRIITERELRYYSQIAEHLGKSARYQFLAEFLQNQEIPELRNKTVPAIRGKLGGHKFFSFVVTPRELLKISFVNHRSLNDPEGAPTYQRIVSKTRIREIGSFIKEGGFFPTNILVNFTVPIRFEKVSNSEGSEITFGRLYLPDKYRSAWIIDGQHRLYGFSPLEDKYLDQSIIVVAFERLSKAEEAQLFVTINHEQRTVPKHLLDDLEGELKWGSSVPIERIGAMASRLITCINADVSEPFHNRVTQQGIPSTNKTCLTIPALKDIIKRSGLIGKAAGNNSAYEKGPLSGSKDAETLEKARCAINLYFNLVKAANPEQWEKGREGFLCTNVAVQAYFMLLAEIVKYGGVNAALKPQEMTSEELVMELEEYLVPLLDFLSHADNALMEKEFKVPFGSGGPPEYFFRLCRILKKRFADFEPLGMENWEAEQSEERITTADQQVKDVVILVQKHIFTVLRQIFGEERDAYWHKGVPDKAIRAKAYQKSLESEDDDRLPIENYLDVIEYKKIVESKQNWPIFKPAFDIPEPGEKGLAKNIKWMDRINELRRISAHPSEKRHYKMEDFEYLDFVYNKLNENMRNLPKEQPQLPEEANEE